jgi:hypothetical protein
VNVRQGKADIVVTGLNSDKMRDDVVTDSNARSRSATYAGAAARLEQRSECFGTIGAADHHDAVTLADDGVGRRISVHVAIAAVDLDHEKSAPGLAFDRPDAHADGSAVLYGGDHFEFHAESAQRALETVGAFQAVDQAGRFLEQDNLGDLR